jgi:hypothetical protein
MSGDEFRRAVAAAQGHLEELDAQGRLQHVALRWDDLIELWGARKTRTLIAIWDNTPDDRRDEKADLIANRAYRDPLHFHAARSFTAEMIRRGEELPTPLRNWAAQLIDGTAKKPPSKRSDTPHQSRNRSLILGKLAHQLANDFSISPTRGAASEQLSACDAVADAWNDQIRKYPKDRRNKFTTYSYERVKDFYYEAKTTSRKENAEYKAFLSWLNSRPFAPPRTQD